MQGHPRTSRPHTPNRARPPLGRPMIDFEEFYEDAAVNKEVLVINVSPYDARIEIATVPGTKPRRFVLEPGESMYLQHGYCVPFTTATRKQAPAWIETHTEVEAWPGERGYNADQQKYVWRVQPGPRLPQVVAEDRARDFKVQWHKVMADKDAAEQAPLKLKLERADGTRVDVDVEVSDKPDPVPMRGRSPVPPMEDDEDQTAGGDEPPPDHNEPLDLAANSEPELPVVTAATVQLAADKPDGKRRGARG